jgi:hypothetical protein
LFVHFGETFETIQLAIAIIICPIFYVVNIGASGYFIIVVFKPTSVAVNICNIMTFVCALRKMHNKTKEFVLLVIQDKFEGHINKVALLFYSSSIVRESF